MSARSEFLVVKTAFALLVCLLLAGNSMAYTLPAPEFLAQFMALAAWAMVALASVMLYPVYALIRFLRGKSRHRPKAEANEG